MIHILFRVLYEVQQSIFKEPVFRTNLDVSEKTDFTHKIVKAAEIWKCLKGNMENQHSSNK